MAGLDKGRSNGKTLGTSRKMTEPLDGVGLSLVDSNPVMFQTSPH